MHKKTISIKKRQKRKIIKHFQRNERTVRAKGTTDAILYTIRSNGNKIKHTAFNGAISTVLSISHTQKEQTEAQSSTYDATSFHSEQRAEEFASLTPTPISFTRDNLPTHISTSKFQAFFFF